MKKNRAEEKDRRDVVLIEENLKLVSQKKYGLYVLEIRNIAFFTAIRFFLISKQKTFELLKFIGLYNYVRYVYRKYIKTNG